MKRLPLPRSEMRPCPHLHPVFPSIAKSIAALAAILVPLCSVSAAEVTIDRNGVVLHTSKPGAAPEFPYRALAAQLLDTLASATGDKLTLTLDARIQFIAEEAMRAVPRGAAVVLDAQTGDVLAMVSVPSFDPNGLTADARSQLKADATAPLDNRAIQAYAPGSTFTTVTALAAASKGLSKTRYNCSGGVTYGNKFLKCWIADKEQGGGHGALTVDQALKNSCGPFFYQYGNAAGIDAIDDIGKLLGLGTKSNLSLPNEHAGILPSPRWLKEISPTERWSAAYTANTSIGQGFVLATPLQMARVAATIGNGGRVPSLRLRLDTPPTAPVDLREHGITPEALEPIRQGMRAVVEEGTGKRARVEGTTVAGKTGTAQFWRDREKDNHTWFIAYAPADEPKIAVSVIVQGGKSGGAVAAPIAARIIERSLHPNPPAPKPLDPAKGSFEQVDVVP